MTLLVLLLLLLVLLGLLVGVFAAGVTHGRRDERRRAQAATRGLRGVLAASRSLAAADWLSSPTDTALRVSVLQTALDDYDDDQRRTGLT